MTIDVVCHHCGRKFRWTIPTPTRERVREMGYRDMQQFINGAKKGWACERCIGWGSTEAERRAEVETKD
jgi:hypothetical protein